MPRIKRKRKIKVPNFETRLRRGETIDAVGVKKHYLVNETDSYCMHGEDIDLWLQSINKDDKLILTIEVVE